MSSDEIILKMENISKRFEMYEKPFDRLKQMMFGRFGKQYFKEFWALRNINFEIHRGECVGVIGKNGAGKSTLLQILVGTLTPTTGTVYTKGRIAALLELGSGFNPEFTGRDNIYLNASLLGLSKDTIEKKYQEIIDFADIGDFVNYPVRKYSSGMVVRLAFAVQIMVNPDIMIVDEALAVGDAAFQRKCYAKLEERLKTGMTLFLVSHSTGVIKKYCSKVIYLQQGECCFYGDPVEGERLYFANLFPAMEQQKATEQKKQQKKEPEPKTSPAVAKDEFIYDADIPPQKLSYGVQFGKIEHLRIYGLKKPNILPLKGKIKIEVDCKWDPELAQEEIEKHELEPNIVVGYCFADAKNISVFGVNTLTEKIKINPFEKDKVKVVFDIQLPEMRNGVYFLTVAMQLGNLESQIAISWYDFVLQFVVQNSHQFGGIINPETTVSCL